LGGIFVSYRRSDSAGEAGRLFDDLVYTFGEDKVFMDVSGIEAGRDFRKAIEEGVTKCGVLLVVMGPEWLTAKDERGASRLNDPGDFVRIETASALRRDIPVIPVLVRGATMPTAEQLPEDLKELAYRNCIELTHPRWKSDVQLLNGALRRLVGHKGEAGHKDAMAPAKPSTPRADAPVSSKVGERTSAAIDAAVLERVRRDLALRIGPMADIVVKRAASRCTSVEALYLTVAEEINSRDEREKFLLGRTSLPHTPVAQVEGPTTPATKSSRASRAPLPSKESNAPSKADLPAPGGRSSSRSKYLLLTSGGAVLLILIIMFVYGTRFTSSKAAGSAHTNQTSPPETHIAGSSSIQAATPLPSTGTNLASTEPPEKGAPAESQPRSSDRVLLPQEKSTGLLINRVSPTYPPLAQKAHVQGRVILEANISKEGAVESLRATEGHPLLVPAAIDAVKQWRYKPYVQNGQPVPVRTQITVNFSLVAR
jgi:TonB family protein